MSIDSMKWHCAWNVQKWDEEAVAWLTAKLGRAPQAAHFLAAGIQPYEDNDIDGNLLTTAGLTRITSLITATGGLQAATNTSARIGTGDSNTAAAVGDTDLSAVAGSTHRWFQIMDATFPTISAGVMTFRSTFGSADGNYAAGWLEFGIDIGTPTVTSGNTVAACLLNHKNGIAQGVKTAGQSWTATATITLT